MTDTIATSSDLDLLDPAEAAIILKLVKRDGEPAVRTLERWRTQGCGPRFVRLGRRVLYCRADLQEWVSLQRRTHTET